MRRETKTKAKKDQRVNNTHQRKVFLLLVVNGPLAIKNLPNKNYELNSNKVRSNSLLQTNN